MSGLLFESSFLWSWQHVAEKSAEFCCVARILFFRGHRGQPLFLKWHFRLKSLFFSICSEETKIFSWKLDDLWESSLSRSLHISSFFLYVHLPGLLRMSISCWSAVSFKHWNFNSTTVSFKNKKEQGCSFAPRLHWENVERNIWMHSSLTSSETSLRSGFSCRSSWPPLPSSHGVSADDFSHLLWGSLRKLPPRSCNSESSTFAKEQG